MKSREGDRSSAYILSGFAAIWICIALATLPKIYGPVILPDEFGYWAQAAAMAGFDWTEVVGQFSWYSYGYGLVMFPFLKFISDPVVMYRCMIGINFCLMWAGSLLLYKTAAKIFSAVESWKLALVSGSSMLYVSCVTYAQTTMTEALLTFLYLLLGYGMLCWFEKPGLQRSILPILTAGYMYMVHLRTIGIVLGTAVCMVFGILFRNKSSAGWKRAFRIILVLCGIAALCCAAGLVKGTLIDRVSSDQYAQIARGNDYGGQWEKIFFLFSLEGIWHFIAGLAGKLFYLGCASFGLYYWGMAFLLRKGKKLAAALGRTIAGMLQKSAWKEQTDELSPADWMNLWVLLSHMSALMITTIYCLRSDRLDGLLYGRYHENTVPMILACGILELMRRPEWKKRLLWLLGILSICFFGVYAFLGTGDILYTNRHSVTGMLYALDFAGRYDTKTMLYAYLTGGAGSAVLISLAEYGKQCGGRRKAESRISIGCVLAFFLLQGALAFYAGKNLVHSANEGQREDIELLMQTRQMLEEDVSYLYDGKSRQMCLAQYVLREITVHPVKTDKMYQPRAGEVFILQKGEETALPEGCTKALESPRYVVYRCEP